MYSPNRSGGLVTVRWRYRLPVSATAASTGVEQDQYESAGIDGASRLQQIWHITPPGAAAEG